MKIEDLIQLLNNRLREFKLSRDYAKMNGDLERMNTAEKEIIGLEDTLFKLNLLVDASKSAVVKEEILAEVITDGSVAVLDEYDITSYATDLLHEEKVMNILSKMGVMDTVEKIDKYIKGRTLSSPVSGDMVMSAAEAYDVDVRLMMAMMQQDSNFGTAGLAVTTLNPGNVGNDDDGNIRTYESWQEGVTAVAEWLSRHRGSTIIPELSEEVISGPAATSTPNIIINTPETSTATSTSTSTPNIVINIPENLTSTSTPASTATSTPNIIVNTPTNSTATSTSTSTPNIVINIPENLTSTSTPATTSTSTPNIVINTPETSTSVSTSTSSIIINTPEPTVENSTSTPNIVINTPEPTPEIIINTPEPTPEISIPDIIINTPAPEVSVDSGSE